MLNVFTGELLPQDVVIEAGRIVELVAWDEGDRRDRAEERDIIDVSGRVIVPGYVEPHAHIGLLADPVVALEQLARTGTTTVVADTYPFLMALSDEEFGRALDELQKVPIFLRWFLAPHARAILEDEEGTFGRQRVERFIDRPDIVALGELTRWPALARGDKRMLSDIERGLAAGKRIEGHAAGASFRRLQRLAYYGVTSDHEAITAEQVVERLRLGFYTMLRHSSLRPDLPVLARALVGGGHSGDDGGGHSGDDGGGHSGDGGGEESAARGDLVHSNRVMLTVDGPTPVWMNEHGYLDYVIRTAIEHGIPPTAAYRMATLNPAMYYGLEHDVGAIAPGRRADINVLSGLHEPTPLLVLAGGRPVAERGRLVEPFPNLNWDEFAGMKRPAGRVPEADTFSWNAESVPTLQLAHSVLLRQGERGVEASAKSGARRPRNGDEDVSDGVRMAVYDWDGRWITRAIVQRFADQLDGAFATSYNAAGQLTVVGRSPQDMADAAAYVLQRRGGMCLVENGEIVWEMPLERGGMFSEMPWDDLVSKLARLDALMEERGYGYHELLYSLFFISFDSLPDYRLTVRGIWDVRQRKTVAPPLMLR